MNNREELINKKIEKLKTQIALYIFNQQFQDKMMCYSIPPAYEITNYDEKISQSMDFLMFLEKLKVTEENKI